MSYGPGMDPSPETPTPAIRTPWGAKALIGVGWGLSFFVAFAHRSSTLIRKGGRPSWAERVVADAWPALVVGAMLASLVAVVILLRSQAAAPRPPGPQGWGGAFVRGIVLAALLCGGLAIYLALGGHDILYYYPWTPVGTAALLAPVLGWISLLEARPAERLRAQIGWALLCGALSVVAMLAAWIQREYVNELFIHGFSKAAEHASAKALDLGANPLWTLAHFAWICVPVTCTAFTRLRPGGARRWLALALCGVVLPWWVRFVPAGDAVIAVTSLLLCVLTPLAWRLGDATRERAATLLFGR